MQYICLSKVKLWISRSGLVQEHSRNTNMFSERLITFFFSVLDKKSDNCKSFHDNEINNMITEILEEEANKVFDNIVRTIKMSDKRKNVIR